MKYNIITIVQIIQQNCFIFFLLQIWRKIADKKGHIWTVWILFQLKIKPC